MPAPEARGTRGAQIPERPPDIRGAGRRLAILLTVQLGFLACILFLSACYTPAGKLTGFDGVSLPGEDAPLRAKLERDGPGFLNLDVSGEEVEFFGTMSPTASGEAAPNPALPPPAAASLLGRAVSDKNGIAELPWKAPEAPGTYLFWVRPKDPKRVPLQESTVLFTVSVIPRDEPVLITDIDNTIAETSTQAVLKDRPQEIQPLPGSAQVLKELTRSYRVLYLTARPTYLAHRTRRWLFVHGFPAGAVLFRDLWAEWRRFNLDEGEFKRRFIQDHLKRRWPEIQWGIGNTENDVLAYAGNGVRAVILAGKVKRVSEKHRDLVRIVEDWDEVRKAIAP